MTSKETMVLYKLIGRGRRYDVSDAVPLFVETLHVNRFSSSNLAFHANVLPNYGQKLSNTYYIYVDLNYTENQK